MDTYSLLREIADSWVLLAMFLFFVGAGLWAYLPSQSHARQDASLIPFRNDMPLKPCAQSCTACTCDHRAAKSEGAEND